MTLTTYQDSPKLGTIARVVYHCAELDTLLTEAELAVHQTLGRITTQATPHCNHCFSTLISLEESGWSECHQCGATLIKV